MDMLEQRNPQMRKAVGVLKELSSDERTRMLYEAREIARRDVVSMISGARTEGRIEGRVEVAQNLLNMKMPVEHIINATGLTLEEIENLYTTELKQYIKATSSYMSRQRLLYAYTKLFLNDDTEAEKVLERFNKTCFTTPSVGEIDGEREMIALVDELAKKQNN